MSGICLTIDEKRNPNLHQLWKNYSEKDFGLLTEVKKGDAFLDSQLYEAFKNSKERGFDLLNFQKDDGLLRLNELALWRDKMWPIGKRITVKFLDRNPFLEYKIIAFANEWSTYANVYFDFIETGNAEIRISLHPDGSSWSILGMAALNRPQNQATINFGWFNNTTPDAEIRRTTLHEFGHAIGCIHEHQTTASPIKWNVDVVYRVYGVLGWDKDMVDNNVLKVFTQSEITNSAFDRDSIMIYPIPSILTDGISIDMNMELSPVDKQFIASCYPK
ncbi:MAG: peptidase M12 [Bacteroidota bacterium]